MKIKYYLCPILIIISFFLFISCSKDNNKYNFHEKLPKEFIGRIESKIGKDGINEIDKLALKYNFSSQDLFKDFNYFKEDIDYKIELFASFLCSVGNEISIHGHTRDAEIAFKTSLKLKPKNNMAHSSLAFLYMGMGKTEEAKKEAKKALILIRELKEKVKKTPIPEEIMPESTLRRLETELVKILNIP